MGVTNYSDGFTTKGGTGARTQDENVQFDSRIRFTISATGETDNGISFGGSTLVNEAGGAAGGTLGSIYISGSFGKLTFGDTGSAIEAATGDLGAVGYTGLGDHDDMTFQYADGESALYSYSMDGLSVYASVGQPQPNSNDNATSLGLSFSTGGFTFGVGTSSQDNQDQTAVSVAGSIAGLGFKVVHVDFDGTSTVDTQTGFSAKYAFTDTMTANMFYRSVDNRAANTDVDYAGVGISYTLGGGAALTAGYVQVDNATNPDTDAMDLGLTFSF